MRILFLLCFLGCFVCGCSRSSTQQEWWAENGKIKILTTIDMIRVFVEEVGGEDVDVLSLISGELDPHSYELVKGDDEKFSCASIIFYNGLGLEHALSLRQKLEQHPCAIAVAEHIVEVHPEAILYFEQQIDPHVWMDVQLWKEIVTPIVETLACKNPAHAQKYQQRGHALIERLTRFDAALYAQIQQIPEQFRFLITSHDAFRYFTRHYLAIPGEEDWEKRCAAPEGLAPDAQISLVDIQEILCLIERYHVSVLFPESNVNKAALRKMIRAGRERGYDVFLAEEELYGDSMGKAVSYEKMIEHNARIIMDNWDKGRMHDSV